MLLLSSSSLVAPERDVLLLIVDLSLKAGLLALIAAVAVRALPERASAARHAVWLSVLAGMLVLPGLSGVVPSLPVALPFVAETTASPPKLGGEGRPSSAVAGRDAVAASLGAPEATGLAWEAAPIALYLTGVLLMLVRLAYGAIRRRRVLAAADPVASKLLDGVCGDLLGRGPRRPAVDVLTSPAVRVPMCVGVLRPRILLPTGWEEWEASKTRAVVAHEVAHLRRRDSFTALLAELNRCLYWFHPVAWRLPMRLVDEAEAACDDFAVARTGDEVRYARYLAEIAEGIADGRGRLVPGALPMAGASGLSARVDAILAARPPASPGLDRLLRRIVAAAACAVILLVSVPRLATAGEDPGGPGDEPDVAEHAGPRAARDAERAPAVGTARRAGNERGPLSGVNASADRARAGFSDSDLGDDFTESFRDATASRSYEFAVGPERAGVRLAIKAKVESGRVSWQLRDPQGQVRLSGNGTSGLITGDTGEMKAISGTWTLVVRLESATGRYGYGFASR